MAKKEDFHKDFNKILGQAKERLSKFGSEVSVLARKSEKEIVRVSKIGKMQLDIVGLKMQKEKLYHEIGKKVASLNARSKINIADLEPFWKKLRKIEQDARKRKRELSMSRKSKK